MTETREQGYQEQGYNEGTYNTRDEPWASFQPEQDESSPVMGAVPLKARANLTFKSPRYNPKKYEMGAYDRMNGVSSSQRARKKSEDQAAKEQTAACRQKMLDNLYDTAAERIGCSREEYVAHRKSGEQWCELCGGWEESAAFTVNDRPTHSAVSCRRSRQAKLNGEVDSAMEPVLVTRRIAALLQVPDYQGLIEAIVKSREPKQERKYLGEPNGNERRVTLQLLAQQRSFYRQWYGVEAGEVRFLHRLESMLGLREPAGKGSF